MLGTSTAYVRPPPSSAKPSPLQYFLYEHNCYCNPVLMRYAYTNVFIIVNMNIVFFFCIQACLDMNISLVTFCRAKNDPSVTNNRLWACFGVKMVPGWRPPPQSGFFKKEFEISQNLHRLFCASITIDRAWLNSRVRSLAARESRDRRDQIKYPPPTHKSSFGLFKLSPFLRDFAILCRRNPNFGEGGV